MKGLVILCLMIFLITGVYATCNETQIDVNAANLTELDKITGIGPVYAQRIIDSRPFYSIDDLIKVSGIGNKTLEKIKIEGLACITEDMENSEPPPEEQTSEEQPEENQTDEDDSNQTAEEESDEEEGNQDEENYTSEKINTNNLTLTTIELNPDYKSIKSEDNKEILKRNLAFAGIITFCITFGGALFLLNIRKRKNEFK